MTRVAPALAFALLSLVPPLAVPGSARAQDEVIAEARTALRSGDYSAAIAGFSRVLRRDPDLAEAARGHVDALLAVGRYEQAQAVAEKFTGEHPASGELQNSLGLALLRQGRWDEAAAAFGRAVAQGASDELSARVNWAELRYFQGERARAMAEFDRFIDIYNDRNDLTPSDLVAVGRAVTYLGIDDPQLFKDALRVFDEAIAADPGDPEPLVWLAELFLEKYNSADAQESFERVIAINANHPRALLGMAKRAHFDGAPGAFQLAQDALEVNPDFVPARIFVARLYMESEKYDDAAKEARRALKVNPVSLEALSALATTRFLQGDEAGFRRTRERVLALNPGYAGLHVMLADVSARNRLYREAAEFAAEAVRLDPKSWRGYALLGVNQLRLGEIEAGRRTLETAFQGDPYDIWTKNTLDLLDTFVRYREESSSRFNFLMYGEESELLSLYFEDLAEEAYERMAAGYGFEPATPIRVEVLRTHADFSVRTIGLAGMAALGVSFGPVIAMDSPGARDPGHFNWGSTLWHEIAHTFHMALSDHRVPRWFSEGLAVYEERRARQGWGRDVTPGFLAAHLQGRLLPISELNNGFVRPTYPQQVSHSYYQASLVCEFIERQAGFHALVAMLHGYRDGLNTAQVVETVLGMKLEELNDAFFTYFEERFARPLASLGPAVEEGDLELAQPEDIEVPSGAGRDEHDFRAQMMAGIELYREGRLEEAERHLLRAKELFPEYSGPGSPYWHLSRVYVDRGEPGRAEAELARLTELNGGDYEAHLELAGLRERLGDARGAAAALERALYIYPFDMGVHRRLAGLAETLGDHELAVRERRAVLALDPTDRADALYRLALAHQQAGDVRAARRAVLQALERAPNFAEAQELLLEIHDKR